MFVELNSPECLLLNKVIVISSCILIICIQYHSNNGLYYLLLDCEG